MSHMSERASELLYKLRPVMESVESSDNLRALSLIEVALIAAYQQGCKDAKYRESDCD